MKRFTAAAFVLIVCIQISFTQSNTSVGVYGGMSFMTGHFGDTYDFGFMFTGNIEYRVYPTLSVTASPGYSHWRTTDVVSFNDIIHETFESSFTTIPLLAGIRYYLVADESSPFLSAEGGIHFVSWTRAFIGDTDSGSASDFGFSIGGGMLFFINPALQIDTHIRYNYINTTGDPFTFMSMLIGVRFVL